MKRLVFILALGFAAFSVKPNEPIDIPINDIFAHIESLAGENGIGARVAGSVEEFNAAKYIHSQFELAGLKSEIRPFSAIFRGEKEPKSSQNIVATIDGKSSKVFVIGAHYDSVPESTGSMGATDNAASIAVMLELAKTMQQASTPKITFMFVAFGAEENGLNGAWEYVNRLTASDKNNIIGMLNLDSIAGGDKMYVHSALGKGYPCRDDASSFNSTTKFRDLLLSLAAANSLPFEKHPGNANFPAGETGGWSDHAPFACVGVPIANIEATNFSVHGKNGKDGYSQTENPKLWSCYDSKTKGTCDKENEKLWGEIWHTQFDRLDALNKEFPNRLSEQLTYNYKLLKHFVATIE